MVPFCRAGVLLCPCKAAGQRHRRQGPAVVLRVLLLRCRGWHIRAAALWMTWHGRVLGCTELQVRAT